MNTYKFNILLKNNVIEKIQNRLIAKNSKDFLLADSIRINLKRQGIILEDTKYGTNWKQRYFVSK